MRYYEKLMIFTFCLLAFSVKTHGQVNYDIFPLATGMHYSYTFYQEEEIWELLYLTQIHSDSGKVEYIIQDSLQYGDTLKIWNIEQRRELLHYKSYPPSWDTTYFIIDTSNYLLSESLTGYHELECSSMVWFFPLNVWPPNVYWTGPDSSIFRYSDFSNFLNVLSSHGYEGGWEDLIWFSTEYGMYRRVTDTYTTGSMSRLYYKRYVYRPDVPNGIIEDGSNIISNYILHQNYPNPFNPSTSIQYAVSSLQFVSLKVYDVLGNEIATLVNEEKSEGSYEVEWNASDFPSGIYFYQLRTANFVDTKKMILLR